MSDRAPTSFQIATRAIRQLLIADDATLSSHCKLDTFRGPGPGGQKRNKTSSGVRVTHESTGLCSTATESRDQSKNRELALRRLRMQMAYMLRRIGDESLEELKCESSWIDTSPKSERYPLIVALVFDVLDSHAWTVFLAAENLGVSTGQLSNFLTRDDDVLNEVNRHRKKLGMKNLGR